MIKIFFLVSVNLAVFFFQVTKAYVTSRLASVEVVIRSVKHISNVMKASFDLFAEISLD